jgi:hypothetical protein
MSITGVHPHRNNRHQRYANRNRDVKKGFDLIAKRAHRSKLEGMMSVSM